MIEYFLDVSNFPARWHCGKWTGALGYTHIISDLIIFLCYAFIPFVIFYYLKKRKDLVFPKLYWAFALFIFTCGLGHLTEAIIFYAPVYRLSALIKVCTAISSVLAVIYLGKSIGDALLLPHLPEIHIKLQNEMKQRKVYEEEILDKNKALVAAHGLSEVIFEHLAVLIVNQQGTIVRASRVLTEMFSYKSSELEGKPVEILVPQRVVHHPSLVQEYMANAHPRKLGGGKLLTGMSQTGQEIPIEIGLEPVQYRGENMMMAVIINMSDHVDHETETEKAKAQLEQFAYIVSHDLQEPIRGIRFQLNKLSGLESPDHPSPQIQRSIQLCKHMENMIEGLLEYSLLSGDVEDIQIIDLNLLVENVNNIVLRTEDSSISLIKENLPHVYGSEVLLNRVMGNIFTNAKKYRKKGERLILLISSTEQVNKISITISDNGIGFPPHMAETIIEPFGRAHSKQEYEGTGVGLAICKKIMASHGGTIMARSSGEGKGSIFTLTFPKNLWDRV